MADVTSEEVDRVANELYDHLYNRLYRAKITERLEEDILRLTEEFILNKQLAYLNALDVRVSVDKDAAKVSLVVGPANE